MTPDLVIGIDCSTTASKALVWDPEGRRVAEGRAALSILAPRPLWHEQPAESWWRATAQALREASARVDLRRLAALCIAHQRETFVPVDERGEPLRDAILWMDERAGDLLPGLAQAFGQHDFHRLTGKPLSGNLSVAKIAWLREYEPQVFRRTTRYLDVHAYLLHCLTGEYRTGWGCADPTGLFDMTRDHWACEMLGQIDLHPEQFPAAFPPGEIVGELTGEAAGFCGLPAGLPVVAGIGDGQASGLGAGVTGPGEAYLSLGTSAITGVFSPAYHVSKYFRTMYSGIPGAYQLEMAILGGTYTLDWLVEKVIGMDSGEAEEHRAALETLEAEAERVPPGAQGLLLVPYWNSAMDPYWDPKASGVIVGLRGAHTRVHIYRAILEGIAFEKRLQTSGLEGVLGERVKRFVAISGGAQSHLWRQIFADVTGVPVVRSLEGEAAALGAGILAATAAGIHPDARQAAQAMAHLETEACEPDEQRHGFYTRLYEEVYSQVYPSLREQLARLTDLTEG